VFEADLIPQLDCNGRALRLDQVRIMGILNVTPDSFSDGGRFASIDACLSHAQALVDAGADVIDVGGESTRPGAVQPSVEEECSRVVPVIEALCRTFEVPVSIDTSRPEVMRAAVRAGAGLINDVRALRVPGALQAAADLQVPVCLMHMQGEPESMQVAPHYDDVLSEVRRFLADRLFACELAGIPRKRLLVDPGFGFGKTAEQNFDLLGRLADLQSLACPILVGLSRKSMLGEVTGKPTNERLSASVVAAVLAADRGAHIVRVHDVAETRDGLSVWRALPRACSMRRQSSTAVAWPDDE
jgi:dihydropteroate synthase